MNNISTLFNLSRPRAHGEGRQRARGARWARVEHLEARLLLAHVVDIPDARAAGDPQPTAAWATWDSPSAESQWCDADVGGLMTGAGLRTGRDVIGVRHSGPGEPSITTLPKLVDDHGITETDGASAFVCGDVDFDLETDWSAAPG